MQAQLSGHAIAVRSEGMRILSLEQRKVYSTEDQTEKQIPDNEDTPDGYTDIEPLGEHYDWDGSQWVKDQQAAYQARIDEIYERLDKIDEQHGPRYIREAVTNGDIPAHQTQVDKVKQAEDEAQVLRDELATLNN